jgi:ParB family chromosome partitioning protein
MNESIQKANITDIIVAQRIRRELVGITELAEDISTNGLLNPVTVMRQDDNFRLLAGFRRLKACESLGWEEIVVNIVSPADAEAALLVEISENVQREPLTFSQIMGYSTLLEDIEEAKAKERMAEGGFTAGRSRPLNGEKGRDVRPYPIENRSRDAIGKILGMSGRTYDRAKYIRENATPEVIARLDAGETSIFVNTTSFATKKKP